MCVSVLKRAVLCLACLGMIVPHGVLASEQIAAPPMNLKLTANGTLNGVVVDTQGKPTQTTVVVRFNGVPVARAHTNSSGRFAVSGVRAGVHQIQAGTNHSVVRLWSAKAAPTSAKTAAVLVSNNVVRAQCGASGCGAGGSCGCGSGQVIPFSGGNVMPFGGSACGDTGCGGGCGGAGFGGCGEGFGPATGGMFGGGFGSGGGGILIGGLVIAGVATAIAIAADDDDDPPASP